MAEVQFINITKAYGTKQVLNGIHLAVDKGSFTCLLGSSGSGKTTLLKLLAGFEFPDTGEVWLAGQPVSAPHKIIIPPQQRGIGYIFQDLGLWPHLSVFDNIAFGLKIKKVVAYQDIVHTMAERLNIRTMLLNYPGQLSGGQQQLVAIARSLVLQPRVLLMDEPLANLDVKLKKVVRDRILELRQEFSLTLIYVTHDHHEAFSMADQVVILNGGHIEAKGTPAEIRQSDNEFIKYFIEL